MMVIGVTLISLFFVVGAWVSFRNDVRVRIWRNAASARSGPFRASENIRSALPVDEVRQAALGALRRVPDGSWGWVGQAVNVARWGQYQLLATVEADGDGHSRLTVAVRPRIPWAWGADRSSEWAHRVIEAITT